MRGSVVKRGNTWSYVVDVGRDPVTGRRRQRWKRGFPTKRPLPSLVRELAPPRTHSARSPFHESYRRLARSASGTGDGYVS